MTWLAVTGPSAGDDVQNRLLIVGVIAAALVIIAILALIRSRRLQERYAIGWLVGALGVGILGAWKGGLAAFSDLIGVSYPPSALFLVIFIFLALVLLDTVIVLSRSVQRTRALAQRVAILEERLARLESADNPSDVP